MAPPPGQSGGHQTVPHLSNKKDRNRRNNPWPGRARPLVRQLSLRFSAPDRPDRTRVFSMSRIFSISSGAPPEAVSSAACRNASVAESRPSTVPLDRLPEPVQNSSLGLRELATNDL